MKNSQGEQQQEMDELREKVKDMENTQRKVSSKYDLINFNSREDVMRPFNEVK